MNKYKIACQVAKDTHIPLKTVIPIVNSVFDTMAAKILDDEKISVSILGSFSLKDTPQKKIYDLARNANLSIPACKKLKFTASPSLQKKIRQKYEKPLAPEEKTALTPSEP